MTYRKKTDVWIASEDGDYVTAFDKRVLLNPFLHQELIQACGAGVEVRCFDNVMGAIKDFGKNAGVTAKKLPTEEKSGNQKRLKRNSSSAATQFECGHRNPANRFVRDLYGRKYVDKSIMDSIFYLLMQQIMGLAGQNGSPNRM